MSITSHSCNSPCDTTYFSNTAFSPGHSKNVDNWQRIDIPICPLGGHIIIVITVVIIITNTPY